MQVGDTWYRYEDFLESNGTNEWGDDLGAHVAIRLRKFTVIKLTPKGVRLNNDRIVIHEHNKRYACATIEEAKRSFMLRKERQISIYSKRVEHARTAIKLVSMNKRTLFGSSLV